MLAELDHRAVACRKDRHQGHEAQIEREVPGHDHAHHAQGLRDHLITRQPEGQAVDAAPLHLHPAAQMFQGMVDFLQHGQHLGQPGLVGRSMAVITRDGLAQSVGVFAHEALERLQIGAARGLARDGGGTDGGALAGQGVLQKGSGVGHGDFRHQAGARWCQKNPPSHPRLAHQYGERLSQVAAGQGLALGADHDPPAPGPTGQGLGRRVDP